MGSDELRVEHDDRVVTITLDRPADQNRLTRDVLLGLQQIVDRLGGDDEVQAVILTGTGREFFSMGILNPTVRASYTKEQILELVRIANRLYDAIEALPQIVIAALNGAARAGAAELSLACDIRLAAAHAAFALPEALWGGFPGAGGPVRLPAIVGRARALELHGPRGRRRRDGAAGARARRSLRRPVASGGARARGSHRRQRSTRHPRGQAHYECAHGLRVHGGPHAVGRPPPRARVEPRHRRGDGRAS